MIAIKEAGRISGDGTTTIFTNSAPRNRKSKALSTKSNHRDSIDRSKNSDSVDAADADMISAQGTTGHRHKDSNSDVKRAPHKQQSSELSHNRDNSEDRMQARGDYIREEPSILERTGENFYAISPLE